MQITYDLRDSDFLGIEWALFRRIPIYRVAGIMLAALLGVPVAVVAALLLERWFGAEFWPALLTSLLVLGTSMTLTWKRLKKRGFSDYFGEPSTAGTKATAIHLGIDEFGVTVRRDSEEKSYPWSAITRILDEEEGILIFAGNLPIAFIPKRIFTETLSRDQLLAAIWKNSKNDFNTQRP